MRTNLAGTAVAFVALAASTLLAADSADVSVGPGNYTFVESVPQGIEIKRYSGIDYLTVDAKIGTFTGLTYKFGVKFAPAHLTAVKGLGIGGTTKIPIEPISDNNIGKSFVDANFRSGKKNGTSQEVELDPSTDKQSTSGEIKVTRLEDENGKRVVVFSFKLKVKGLVVVKYDKDGEETSRSQSKKAQGVSGTVRVTM